MSEPSIFSGLKLSDKLPVAPAVPVDQRLFAPAAAQPGPKAIPPPRTARASPAPQEAPTAAPVPPALSLPTVGKEGKRERGKPEIPLEAARSERPLTEPATRTVSRFDITEKPWRKDSFLFTDAEFDRLEDFKLELRRRFDVKVTKNDIARAAFQCLYEDYTHDPKGCTIVRHLRSKKT